MNSQDIAADVGQRSLPKRRASRSAPPCTLPAGSRFVGGRVKAPIIEIEALAGCPGPVRASVVPDANGAVFCKVSDGGAILRAWGMEDARRYGHVWADWRRMLDDELDGLPVRRSRERGTTCPALEVRLRWQDLPDAVGLLRIAAERIGRMNLWPRTRADIDLHERVRLSLRKAPKAWKLHVRCWDSWWDASSPGFSPVEMTVASGSDARRRFYLFSAASKWRFDRVCKTTRRLAETNPEVGRVVLLSTQGGLSAEDATSGSIAFRCAAEVLVIPSAATDIYELLLPSLRRLTAPLPATGPT